MGFELSALICGPLPSDRIVPITAALLARWPFLRLPITTAHPEHVLLGSIERTSYMCDAHHEAQLLDAAVSDGLVEFSREFPEHAFAWIHTDCFGGLCDDDALIAQAGARQTLDSVASSLAAVGIESSGFFAAFERDHFGSNVDPRGFLACLPEWLVGELADVEPDPPLELPLGPEHAGAEPTQWLARCLAAIHERAGLSPLEREVIAMLDVDPGTSEPLHVLADALGLAGDPRAEWLALDLQGRRLGWFARKQWKFETELELGLSSLAEATPAHHLRVGEWWPRLWVELRGPFLTRLVVRTAVFEKRDAPIRLDDWQPYERATLPFVGLRALLELPCARYLSERRVTLLRCPIQPDLSGRDLRALDLSGLDLRSAKLAGARLDRANLAKLDAAHVELVGASLVGADLREADLRQADLREADLREAKLAGTDLRFADLRGAKLEGSSFAAARSIGARL